MSIEAMKLALFALDIVKIHYTQSRHINEAIAALKERLAQPEQEPVAWINAEKRTFEWNGPVLWNTPTVAVLNKIPLYTHPPHRTEPLIGCVNHDCAKCKERTEQEPLAWMDADGNVSDNNDHKCFPIPLYTHPPQRTWVGLTEQEALDCFSPNPVTHSKNVEAKLKQKNGYAEEKNT